MPREIIETDAAPAAIGTYSQAVKHGDVVYLSGQIPLDPVTMEMIAAEPAEQIEQVLKNLEAVSLAAGGSLARIVKLTVYLTNLDHFAAVNEIMSRYFEAPFPARAAIGVAALPRGALVEMDAIMVLD